MNNSTRGVLKRADTKCNRRPVAIVEPDVKELQRNAAQHSVHPTGGSLRVFKRFVWLEVGSGKMALSPPTHQRVTPAVGWQVKVQMQRRVSLNITCLGKMRHG